MLAKEESGIIDRSKDFQESTFKICASRKAFDILSSKIYTNPIRAIIRELSTNAYDSHVEAKAEGQPFEIHLPNELEPFFSIRDYGTGLSHENIVQLYTTYFDSNKTHSNEYVGCLGLGSKSPFSYTDSFMVTSFFHREKRTYNLFIGEEGIPKVALMQVINTNEKDGLLVKVGVKKGEETRFVREAQEVLKYFFPQPKVSGNSSFEIKEEISLLSGERWELYLGQASSLAIMGNIAYPINGFSLHNTNFFSSEEENLIRTLLQSRQIYLRIMFEIGSLDISASREDLHYSKKTILNIAAALKPIFKYIKEEVEKEIKEAPSYWDACVRRLQVVTSLPSQIKDAISSKIEWNGKVLTNSFTLPESLDNLVQGYFCHSTKRGKECVSLKAWGNRGYISLSQPITIILIDENLRKVKTEEKFKLYMRERNSNQTYLVLSPSNLQQKEEIYNYFGINDSHITLLSTLKDPPKKTRRKDSGQQIFRYISYSGGIRRKTDYRKYWEKKEVNFSYGGLYVPLDRYQVVKDNTSFKPNLIRNIIYSVKRLGIEFPEIYGIPIRKVKKVQGKTQWKNLFEYAKEQVEIEVKKKDLQDLIEKELLSLQFSKEKVTKEFLQVLEKIGFEKKLAIKDPAIKKMGDFFQQYPSPETREMRKIAEELEYYSLWSVDRTLLEKRKEELEKLLSEIENRYPLLNYLQLRGNFDSRKWESAVLNYINERLGKKENE